MFARLSSATVTARLSGWRGRAIATAKNHHFIVDSPLALGGPNEEINPIDLLLSALATHATFVCERYAQEQGIRLEMLVVAATGEFDPRGIVRGELVEPNLQQIQLRLTLAGVGFEEANALADAVRTRCPVYATLARAVPIEIRTVIERPTLDLPQSNPTHMQSSDQGG
ncbi:MAG: OsmC family protein [Chloroflexi bacterium]|nr:OsmC family protein [Chloroflexota bacterium]